jgi:hypothetical protein
VVDETGELRPEWTRHARNASPKSRQSKSAAKRVIIEPTAQKSAENDHQVRSPRLQKLLGGPDPEGGIET